MLLSVENLIVKYGNIQALHGISFNVNRGEIVTLIGANGAGKSTLLNTLTGRIPAKSGSVTLNDQPVSRQLRRKISYVMQQDVFYPSLTLKETLTVDYDN